MSETSKSYIQRYFSDFQMRAFSLDHNAFDLGCSAMIRTGDRGGRIFIVGNGGSAAIASHVAVDITKNLGISALNFNEADFITCYANDFGYDNWVEKAIRSHVRTVDLVILISSSGNSMNMINGAKVCEEIDIEFMTFSGFSPNNKLRNYGDIRFWVDSNNYNHVESIHQLWLLSMVDFLAANLNKG